jgi:hypothetical protein
MTQYVVRLYNTVDPIGGLRGREMPLEYGPGRYIVGWLAPEQPVDFTEPDENRCVSNVAPVTFEVGYPGGPSRHEVRSVGLCAAGAVGAPHSTAATRMIPLAVIAWPEENGLVSVPGAPGSITAPAGALVFQL